MLAGGPAAIDGQACARDQRCRRRSEKDNGAGDLVHAPNAAERNSADDPIAEFGIREKGSGHGRFEKSGSDGVHADIFRREFDGHGFGEAFDGVLGHAVDGAPLGADAPHLGSDVNYAAALLAAIGMLEHFFYRSLGDEKCGADVEGDHIVQVGRGDIDKGLGDIHSGVVQKDVEAVEAGERGTYLLSFGDIADDYARRASGFGDAFCDFF